MKTVTDASANITTKALIHRNSVFMNILIIKVIAVNNYEPNNKQSVVGLTLYSSYK